MNYPYYSEPTQASYEAFLGMHSSHALAHMGPDATTQQSIESLTDDQRILYPTSYDAFGFANGLPTPQQGSPDNVAVHTPMAVGSVDSGLGPDYDDGQAGGQTRSSSEEKDSLTPAQSRRKAQNRAAQRAFRERKERHVKELETKLSALESSTHSLQSDNERLKAALARARTENEILRATSGHSRSSSRSLSASYPSPGAHLPLEYDDDEMEQDGIDYHVESLTNGTVVNAAGREHTRQKGKEREIPAAQAWDLIQEHPLVKQGLVDVADACERLKGKSICDGHGPVFAESAIWQAVEESRRSGGDELI